MIGQIIKPERFAALYREVVQGPVPPFSLSFYPYSTLKNTVRQRNGCLLFRLSDIQRDASTEVIEAAVVNLLCALFKKRPPLVYQRAYDRYVEQDQVREATRRSRASRGVKRVVAPRGIHYDLSEMLPELNDAYFRGEVQVNGIYWSPGKSVRRLGHWDPAHRVIVISRSLDSADVPEYVVRYIVFHEMLHVVIPPVDRGSRTYFHTKAFREAEKKFVDYEQAKWFIEKKLNPG